MEATKRIAKNTGFLYARTGITMFISLYTTRLILNALGASDFGLFNIVAGSIAMLGFLNASMVTTTQRFINYAEGQGNLEGVKQIFNVTMVLHIIIALIFLILLEVAGYFFFNGFLNIPANRIDTAKLIYQYMIISTLLTVMSVPYDAVINAHEHMLLVSILGIVESVLKLVIALVIMDMSGDRLQVYGMLTALLSVGLLLFRRIYCYKKYEECRLNLKKYYDKKLMRQLSGFGGWSLMGSASSMITYYGQGIVINLFFGTAVNAAQGIANQIFGQLSVFASNMLKALNPNIDKHEGAGLREQMLRLSVVGSKASFFLLALFFVPAIVETPYILQIWVKNVPIYAVIFCQLLLFRNLIEQIFTTLTSSIIAVGKIRTFQIIASILNIFPLVVTYYLFSLGMPAYTIYVVFIIYSVARAINVVYFTHRYAGLSISLFVRDVVLRCFISLGLIVLITLLPRLFINEGMLRLIVVLTLNIIGFFIVVWSVGLCLDERKDVLKLINHIKFFKKPILFARKFGLQKVT